MTSHSTVAVVREGQLLGRHVLAMLVCFFGIIFVANGFFLFAALSTHSGEVASEPYRKGLAYNARIAAGERQAGREWRDTLTVATTGTVSLMLLDRAGAPVPGLIVTATIGRPSTIRHDRSAPLIEQAAGSYVAGLGALEDGNWLITIEARSPSSGETTFRSRKRLWLRS